MVWLDRLGRSSLNPRLYVPDLSHRFGETLQGKQKSEFKAMEQRKRSGCQREREKETKNKLVKHISGT